MSVTNFNPQNQYSSWGAGSWNEWPQYSASVQQQPLARNAGYSNIPPEPNSECHLSMHALKIQVRSRRSNLTYKCLFVQLKEIMQMLLQVERFAEIIHLIVSLNLRTKMSK